MWKDLWLQSWHDKGKHSDEHLHLPNNNNNNNKNRPRSGLCFSTSKHFRITKLVSLPNTETAQARKISKYLRIVTRTDSIGCPMPRRTMEPWDITQRFKWTCATTLVRTYAVCVSRAEKGRARRLVCHPWVVYRIHQLAWSWNYGKAHEELRQVFEGDMLTCLHLRFSFRLFSPRCRSESTSIQTSATVER